MFVVPASRRRALRSSPPVLRNQIPPDSAPVCFATFIRVDPRSSALHQSSCLRVFGGESPKCMASYQKSPATSKSYRNQGKFCIYASDSGL